MGEQARAGTTECVVARPLITAQFLRPSDRKQVIAGGAIIVRKMMETLGISAVLVSDLGLREGVLIDLSSRLV